MATERAIPESSPDTPSIIQQHTEDEAVHRQSIEIVSKGLAVNPGNSNGTFDSGDGDTTTTTESILPPVTPAILEEYQKEQALKAQMKKRQRKDRMRHSILACFGIPSCLMLVMIGLVLAVLAGTIAAVLVYDPSDGIQPPSDTPTLAPSETPS